MRLLSLFSRLIRGAVFRLVPALLLIGMLWFGTGVVSAVVRVISERNDYENRREDYGLTATAAAPTLVTFTPTPEKVAQADFSTNTPQPPAIILPPSNTPPHLPEDITETEIPAATLPQPTAPEPAPRPLPTLIPVSTVDPDLVAATAVPTIVPTLDRHGYDLVNVLLLGTDSELTGDNFDRTDTMIVVSINRSTNTVAMLSFPRDLFVYIPGWTMQRLNLAFTRGEQTGWTDGGFGLMRETLLYNFGLNVHYYAVVNLSGFKTIIDTLGGIDIAVDCAIQDPPLIDAPPPVQAIQGENNVYTLPVGYYTFDGGAALWYARSRGNSSDFDRGRRQQQILRAIWRKARDTGDLARFPELWSQATEVVTTNLVLEDILGLLPLALRLDTSRIEQFTFKRLYHTTPWQPPDGSFVQLPIFDTVREMLNDFYQPPTTNQAVSETTQILVYNGTGSADWDRVAAESLAWKGFTAVAAGSADNTDYPDTLIIDRSGRTKGSRLADIAKALNVRAENIRIEPDPNRQADYEVIIGSSYNSCTEGGVLPIEENTGG